ncbi:RICIN domain-containing protein [Kitasatospora sp. NPDC036755]|uniref:RICIN domain-containing protein n=1 Tax=Kitasatospora sp. NPDC036755 TaxID=3154600 RepID=UPI0033F4E7D1
MFLGAAALVALPMGGAASAHEATGNAFLGSTPLVQNDHSGRCLVARGFSESNAVQFGCDYTVGTYWADQHWTFLGPNTDDLHLVNANSGLCLAVRGGLNDAVAVQAPCDYKVGTNWQDQHWQVRFDPNGNFHFMLANHNSGKCLVVRGFDNDSQAVQFTCDNGFQDQWWHQA